MESLKAVEGTLVFYESPYRIDKLLGELNELYPRATVVLERETYEAKKRVELLEVGCDLVRALRRRAA